MEIKEIEHFTESPELQHFAMEKVSKNDNVYGVTWGNLVREYLRTAYSEGSTQAEVVSFGSTYKVLKRNGVTAFYDADGNTLFDVENARLEKEYKWLMDMPTESEADGSGPITPMGKTIAGIEKQAFETATKIDAESVKTQAKQKLEKEFKEAKDKIFAEPVIGYLLDRCAEDAGLAHDVVQAHKTWQKCFEYIYSQARKQAKGRCATVRDEVVYEWAEDYYHRDDKAEEDIKAKKAAERKEKRKKKAEEWQSKAENVPVKTTVASQKKETTPEEPPKPKRSGRNMEGQLDMFSMLGM